MICGLRNCVVKARTGGDHVYDPAICQERSRCEAATEFGPPCSHPNHYHVRSAFRSAYVCGDHLGAVVRVLLIAPGEMVTVARL